MKAEMNIFRLPKLLICISIAFAFHLSPLTLQAQQPVRHNCWDLETTDNHSIVIPMAHIIARADSGIMLIAMAKEYLGTPYRYGGRTPKGFDCAGYAHYLYSHFGYDLPGWSGAQAQLGTEVSDTRNLQPGDLVFFGGRHHHRIVGHTGIVVATDTATGVFTFIHSSTHNGVIISRSTEPYYAQRYLSARRLFR